MYHCEGFAHLDTTGSFQAFWRAMKSGLWKQVLLVFAAVVALYAVAFGTLEHLRNRRGGWVVVFQSDAAGQPGLAISQPALNLAGVRIEFPGAKIAETNLALQIHFDQPRTNVPFGRVIFFDTTFLPGTLTLEMFGHEIELLPRVLVADRREIPWQSDWVLKLPAKPDPK